MSSESSEKELRPCPFCGRVLKSEHWEGDGDIVDPPCIGEYFTVEEWQNAYCWKELDQARARIKELEEALEKYRGQLADRGDGVLRMVAYETLEALASKVEQGSEGLK